LPGSETPAVQPSQVAVEELKPVVPHLAPEKVDQVASAQTGEVAAASATNVAQPFTGTNPLLVITATADTWVEVVGQDGKLRVQRLLKQGESISFDDSPAFSVVLGNASGAQVLSKGVAFDLTPVVKNNIARFEVKRS
jgi:cytoskeleton protein RodZ